MPAWVVAGPGDDAAVVVPERGAFDVFTTDALVEGVHFDRRFSPAPSIGHRALAVNLSDLAAMGATPRACLLSLALPDHIKVSFLDGFLDGLLELAAEYGVALVGGNLTRTPGPITVDVTAIGAVRPRRILRRAGARPGDDVYVTGTLGAAAAGLLSLLAEHDGDGPGRPERQVRPEACEARYLRPCPRVRAGLLLGRNRAASSCMDLSDGLADALHQLARASGVGMLVDAAAVPIDPEAGTWLAAAGRDPLQTALAAGDDYELAFTVRPRHRGRLRGVERLLRGLPIARIGTVTTHDRGVMLKEGHEARPLPDGYQHFT